MAPAIPLRPEFINFLRGRVKCVGYAHNVMETKHNTLTSKFALFSKLHMVRSTVKDKTLSQSLRFSLELSPGTVKCALIQRS